MYPDTRMSDTFSTAASHAFEHPELPEPAGPSSSSMGEAASELSIEDAFDVPSTIQLIMSGGYKTVSPGTYILSYPTMGGFDACRATSPVPFTC